MRNKLSHGLIGAMIGAGLGLLYGANNGYLKLEILWGFLVICTTTVGLMGGLLGSWAGSRVTLPKGDVLAVSTSSMVFSMASILSLSYFFMVALGLPG